MTKDYKWKVLNTKYMHKDPWFTARKDTVQLPTGKVIEEYFVLEYPTWANVVAVTKDNKFVFVKQYRHGLGVTEYELCAGVCDAGDCTPLTCAQRELLEETGYGGGDWKELMTLSPNPATHTNRSYSFLAVGVEKIAEPNLEETEDISTHLLTLEEVKELIKSNAMSQSLHVAPLLKYLYDNKL
ncbi:ADP-ribose pyrophosphatase [Elusimicrobium posterum]|uniref:NUDIX hydrolase n=1 Tax=Elusimicrobium posterum TaxID=3116653 RepID=UPI003C785CE6